MRWGTNENRVQMEWAVCGCQLGDQWDRVGRNCVDEWKGGPICSWGLMNWGTNEKGTNELGDQWDGGPMSRGDQWDGGPMEWVMHGCQLGDQWDGRLMSWGPMRWGTNEMGDQWDGGPLRLADDGVTNEMGDQWAPIMYWGTNELGDQWEGDQWDGGPMRWGTSERIPCLRYPTIQSTSLNLVVWPTSCFYVPSAVRSRCARNVKAARGSDLNRTSIETSRDLTSKDVLSDIETAPGQSVHWAKVNTNLSCPSYFLLLVFRDCL